MTSDAESDFAHEDDSEVIWSGAPKFFKLIFHNRLEECWMNSLWKTSARSAKTSQPSSGPLAVRRTNVTVTQLFEHRASKIVFQEINVLSRANRVDFKESLSTQLQQNLSDPEQIDHLRNHLVGNQNIFPFNHTEEIPQTHIVTILRNELSLCITNQPDIAPNISVLSFSDSGCEIHDEQQRSGFAQTDIIHI